MILGLQFGYSVVNLFSWRGPVGAGGDGYSYRLRWISSERREVWKEINETYHRAGEGRREHDLRGLVRMRRECDSV